MTLEFSDKILREFYDLSVPIRFGGGEKEVFNLLHGTYDSGGSPGTSGRLYRVRRSWFSA